MAKIQDAELPITSLPERGPGVVAWENRTEKNDAPQFDSNSILANFNADKTALFDQVRKILAD